MDRHERFVLQHTAKKMVDEAFKDTSADMKDELRALYESTGADRIKVKIGDYTLSVSLVEGRKTVEGDGDEFFDFMLDHDMCALLVKPDWKDHVSIVDNKPVWKETGEIVPGAYVKASADYPKLSGIKASERADLLMTARRIGLIGNEGLGITDEIGTTELIGDGNEG